MTPRARRGLIVAVVVLALAVGGYFGGRALWQKARSVLGYDHCDVGNYQVDPGQAAVAATMVGAVTKYRTPLPERASVLVLAAALQESKLQNLPPGAGDRDSVGVLQQRPSQGWGDGSAQRLTDVFEATTEFLNHLVQVPHWQRLPLSQAVQAVQVSADASAYAPHEGEAQALADALQGHRPAAINCTFGAPTKVAPAATVAAQVARDLPINRPAVDALHVRVPGAHWQTAAWFVANADRLGIDSVAYDGRQWRLGHGWSRDAHASAAAVVATLDKLRH